MIEPSDEMMAQYQADQQADARRAITDAHADQLDLLDQEFEIPCDCDHGKCKHPAAWIMWRVKCCPAPPSTILSCERHKRWLDNMAAAECLHCERRFAPAITGFHRVEPLHPRKDSPK